MKSAAIPSQAPPAAAPADAAPPLRSRFLHAPVRKQVTLLVFTVALGSVMAGIAEAHLGHRGWPLLLTMAMVLGGVMMMAKLWVIAPLEQLLKDVQHADMIRRPTRRYDKPLDTSNEVHQLGEYVHRISVEAYRQSTTVNQLRRTLDHRVAEATRRATQQLEQLALRDPLTDLANRRFVQENLDTLITTCRSASTDLLCIAIDMDNFKQVNDRLGHAKGDELLVFLAQVMRANIRAEDCAVRLGGDEFLIFLPGCETVRAAEILDRIRGLFQQHARIAVPGDIPVSLSMGVASLERERGVNGAGLMEKADAMLYAAKQAGKGRMMGLTQPLSADALDLRLA